MLHPSEMCNYSAKGPDACHSVTERDSSVVHNYYDVDARTTKNQREEDEEAQ